MIDPTEIEAAIDKIKGVPSGEIFKAIGGVLHAHQSTHKITGDILIAHGRRLDELEQWHGRALIGGRHRLNGHPINQRCPQCPPPGKFRKACAALLGWLKFFSNWYAKK